MFDSCTGTPGHLISLGLLYLLILGYLGPWPRQLAVRHGLVGYCCSAVRGSPRGKTSDDMSFEASFGLSGRGCPRF